MLSSGWTHSNTENKREAVKGACTNRTSVQPTSEKSAPLMPKRPTRVKPKKKMKKMTNTVFNVSLPLSEGEMLLQGRTSFSADNLLESYSLCSSDYDPVSSLDAETAVYSLECESPSFAVAHEEESPDFQTSPLQQDPYESHEDSDQYIPGHNSDYAFQDEDDDGRLNKCFSQFEDITGTENNTDYEEWKYKRQHDYHEKSSHDASKQSEELFPAMPQTKDQSYNFYPTQQGDVAEQDYSSALNSKVETREEALRQIRYTDMSSNAVQNCYQQQYQSEQMAWANANVHPGFMWGGYGMYGEVSPYLNTAMKNMQAQSGSAFIQDVGMSSAPTAQFHNADVSQMQTCTLFTVNHLQALPQNYMTQSTTYQASQADPRLMSSIDYNVGPWPNPVQHLAHPSSGTGSDWNMMQANAVIQPGQPLHHKACPDV